MPTEWASSHRWTACSVPPSDGSMLMDGSRCGIVEAVAGQISGGWENAEESTARASATVEMQAAYQALYWLGHAHSIEVWQGSLLVGGLYGVAIGRMFFAESMFSAVSGGSKIALAALATILREWGWPMFDAQVESPHLLRMGARIVPRVEFLALAAAQTALSAETSRWTTVVGNRDVDWLLGSTVANP